MAAMAYEHSPSRTQHFFSNTYRNLAYGLLAAVYSGLGTVLAWTLTAVR